MLAAGTCCAGLALTPVQAVLASTELPDRAQQFLKASEINNNKELSKIRRSRYFATSHKRAHRKLPRGRRHIVVNIPERMLYAIDRNGRVAMKSRVIIGKPDTPTPVHKTNVVSGKFFPDWTAPTSIGLEKLDRRVNNGMMLRQYGSSTLWKAESRTPDLFTARAVDAGGAKTDTERTIRAVDMINGRFYFYIPPSNSGPMGKVKLVLNSKHGVHLHDTDDVTKYNHDTRMLSHGCVRVEDIEALTAWTYRRDSDWLEDELGIEKMRYKRLRKRVPVYMTYFLETNWPGQGVERHEDVYEVN